MILYFILFSSKFEVQTIIKNQNRFSFTTFIFTNRNHISQGTEIFPFSYFENPWLEYDNVIEYIKNVNTFDKTRT